MSGSPADKLLPARVLLTREQFHEINRRAGLRGLDGRARSEYVIGCALDLPRDELLVRVHEIRDAERARLRAEILADRQRGAERAMVTMDTPARSEQTSPHRPAGA